MEQIALTEMAPELSADLGGLDGLNSFRDHSYTECLGDFQNGRDHFLPRLGRVDAVNQRLVDLQVMRRNFSQFQKPRLPRAEVIVGKLDTESGQ